MSDSIKLEKLLRRYTAEGRLYEPLPDDKVRCYACAHRCVIQNKQRGVCRVRFNEGGKLFVPWGYVGSLNIDPIEKKPFFHAYPGAKAASFGMLGCDFHCGYCQNWITSQALRDENAVSEAYDMTPERFVALAVNHGARVVTSTYNEPLITSEWAVEIFNLAKKDGLVCSYVSNGNATREVLEFIRPYVDLFKVDLKSFQDKNYRRLGGTLERVTETIGNLAVMGFWVEVVTLVVPNFNDSDGELRDIAGFLSSVSADIPWHVTAFHSDYRMSDTPDTPAETLYRAWEIGREAGLRYVYAGNKPGMVGDRENTRCHECGELLVERSGFRVLQNRLKDGRCPQCSAEIPGRWD